MKIDRTSPEAIAFHRAYQVLVETSPEAPDFLAQTVSSLSGSEPPRRIELMARAMVVLAVIVATGFGVVWLLGPESILGQPSSGQTVDSTTTMIETTSAEPRFGSPGPVALIDIRCSSATALPDACINLIDGTWVEARIDVTHLPSLTSPLTFELTFAEPMVIEEILFTNPGAGESFDQSLRVKSLTILADGNEIPLGVELEDRPGAQSIPFAALSASWVRMTVQAMWPASSESSGQDVLAIAEISVIGYPTP